MTDQSVLLVLDDCPPLAPARAFLRGQPGGIESLVGSFVLHTAVIATGASLFGVGLGTAIRAGIGGALVIEAGNLLDAAKGGVL